MKILFFFTSYRQFQEFEYQFKIIESYKYIKPDIFIYNNNPDIDASSVIDLFNINKKIKSYYFNDNINSGYVLGLFDGINKCFDSFNKYDYVVHLHPDVFLINDKKIYDFIIENPNYEFYLSKLNDDYYFADFFIFKPSVNFFKNYLDYSYTNQAETILSKICIQTKNVFFNRYDSLSDFHVKQRQIDNFDIIHSHNIKNIENIIL
jgi:hypothetical protein